MWDELLYGWVPDDLIAQFPGVDPRMLATFGQYGTDGAPPQHIIDYLAQVGTPWDPAKYSWDGATGNLTDRASGSSYDMRSVPNNSLGSYVVLPGGTARTAESGGAEVPNNILQGGGPAYYFEPGQGPTFFGNPGGSSGNQFFFSNDPAAIDAYQHDAQTRNLQGIAQIAALVGGAGALASTPWGSSVPGGGSAAGLSEITLPASVAPINNAIPFTAGAPSAAAFGTGPITSVASGTAANAAASAARAGGGSTLTNPYGSQGADAALTGGTGGGGMFENLLSGGLGGFLNNWGPLIGGLLGAIDANNQPDSMTVNQGGTSSSTYGQTLPEQITGPAGQALSQLQGLFGQGYNVAGADPNTTAALARLQNLGTNPFATGGPTNTAPTTSSFASGAGINPYLDQVFNAAADSTQNRLATEFANAGGFGSGSHGQARSQELQNLAAGIYAPGYEAERSRQYGAQESGVDRLLAQMEANLGRQYGAIEGNLGRDLSSIYPMLTGGDYLRNIQQQQNDASYTNLARYLSGLQGVMPFFPGTQTQNTQQTGSVTQPLFNNPLAGFLGGAQLGSLFGG